MKRTRNGVNLTKREWEQLREAYDHLYITLSYASTSLEDYFIDRKDYLNVVRWHQYLHNAEFVEADWIGENA